MSPVRSQYRFLPAELIRVLWQTIWISASGVALVVLLRSLVAAIQLPVPLSGTIALVLLLSAGLSISQRTLQETALPVLAAFLWGLLLVAATGAWLGGIYLVLLIAVVALPSWLQKPATENRLSVAREPASTREQQPHTVAAAAQPAAVPMKIRSLEAFVTWCETNDLPAAQIGYSEACTSHLLARLTVANLANGLPKQIVHFPIYPELCARPSVELKTVPFAAAHVAMVEPFGLRIEVSTLPESSSIAVYLHLQATTQSKA